MRQFVICVVLVGLGSDSVRAALHIEFDYRYDTLGFFEDPTRREALEAAGRIVNRYTDDLDALIPSDGNGLLSLISHPGTGGDQLLRDEAFPAGTVKIFVAGRPLAGRLAQAIEYSPLGTGDPDWIEMVAHRGQSGAANQPASDYGPTGSTISFNSDLAEVPWHFDLETTGLNANEFDFITVAMHEIVHALGVGVSRSFADRINAQGEFQGAASLAVGSPTNPTLKVSDNEDHWQSGTKSSWNGSLQEALLAPGIFPGRRAFPTRLDRAALRDVGWQEALAGDANRDGLFNSTDLIDALQAGLYESGRIAGWSEGDWDDNALFDSGDLIAGLQTGTYEQIPFLATPALPIPEPAGIGLMIAGWITCARFARFTRST